MFTSLVSIASYPFRAYAAPGATHRDRLEQFYKSQANSYDAYRERFLWGREPLLQACAVRLGGSMDRAPRIWVDLGGGTGYNVERMASILGGETMLRAMFKEIYIVDLCPSLCARARARIERLKWSDFVHVIEADAAQFRIQDVKNEKKAAQLVTLSYALSMMPPFLEVVDHIQHALLDPNKGLLGVCDFAVSAKHNAAPLPGQSWLQRTFWKSLFDLDNIEVGPERLAYLKHRFMTLYDRTACGSIPWIPYLKPPYYVWIGCAHIQDSSNSKALQRGVIYRAHDMPLTHPTMIYNMSWEDPAADAQVMNWKETDTVLTLTGGGCNALNLLVTEDWTGRKGVKRVISVDCNPAQSALLELKKVAFERLPSYAHLWRLFGEGRHIRIESIYEQYLEPYLSPHAHAFWKPRLRYFKKGGLYEQGGMGILCRWIRWIIGAQTVDQIRRCQTLTKQAHLWDLHWLYRLLTAKTKIGMGLRTFVTYLFANPASLWFGCGVPKKQAQLLEKESPVWKYVLDTIDGVMRNTYLPTVNYFYWNVLTGSFAPENCPEYLKEYVFDMLRERVGERLVIVNDTMLGQLKETPANMLYDKVILMDHMDWQDDAYAKTLTEILYQKMSTGGRVGFRSAATQPSYGRAFEAAGFKQVHCAVRQPGHALDRVNMYASFWVFEK